MDQSHIYFLLLLTLFAAILLPEVMDTDVMPITGFQIATQDNSMVERSFVYTTVGPGEEFVVYIDVYIPEQYEHYQYNIEENVPSGWVITDIGGAAQAGQRLSWTYNEVIPAEPTSYEFRVQAPGSGTGIFVGTFSFDSLDNDSIYGDTQIGVGTCTNNDVRSCTTVNNCDGEQTCVEGYWGSCISIENYCDIDCDGDQECSLQSCGACFCTGNETQSCTTVNGCQGLQICNGGSFGQCVATENFCDIDCDGSQDCTSEACLTCTCAGSETRNCLTANGCQGQQTCNDGLFGPCVATQNFCDTDCDGSQECTNDVCDVCSCTGSENSSCLTSNNCQGIQVCNHGEYGPCTATQNFCDLNCDGTPECTSSTCPSCGCIENWVCSGFSACVSGVQSRSCTDQNSCGTEYNKPTLVQSCGGASSGGGGGGGGPSTGCRETWTCTDWGACVNGVMLRSCSDANSCGTTLKKPTDLEMCTASGNCFDGFMNNDEEGVDCGGQCQACEVILANEKAQLEIFADPINAEILDTVVFTVVVKNTGNIDAENLYIALDKWTTPIGPVSISSGKEKEFEFRFKIPGDVSADSVDVQAVYKDVPLEVLRVPVNLLVPSNAVKLYKHMSVYRAIVIVDNRELDARAIDVRYEVVKKGESHYSKEVELFADSNSIVQETQPDDIILTAGTYDVKSSFYQDGSLVGEYSYVIEVEGAILTTSNLWIFIVCTFVVIGIVTGLILVKKR